jgi:hypothetical protein
MTKRLKLALFVLPGALALTLLGQPAQALNNCGATDGQACPVNDQVISCNYVGCSVKGTCICTNGSWVCDPRPSWPTCPP